MERLLLTGFSGRLPKLSAKLLKQNQAQVATNCDLRSGEIKPFKALNQDATTYDAAIISVSPIDTEMFTSTLDCDFVKHDIDGTPTLLVSDGTNYPKQYTDALYPSDHRRLGVVPPTSALAITFNTIGGISDTEIVDTVSYVYTYVTSWGEESAPSTATPAVNVQANQYITLTNFDTPVVANKNDITAIRIYRVSTGLKTAEYYYLDEVDDQTTTYNDYEVGVGLKDVTSDILPTENWIQPPDGMAGLCRYANGMLAGFKDNTLYLCEPFVVYAWPTQYTIDFDSDIVGIKPYNESIIVCTTTKTYIVSGNSPDIMVPVHIPTQQACISKRTMVETNAGVMYASPDGLTLVNETKALVVTSEIITKEQWQALTPADIISFWYDEMYIGFFAGTDTGFTIIDGSWVDIDLGGGTVEGGYVAPDTDKLWLIMDRTSYAYLESFNDHATNYLTYTWKSKQFDFNFPTSYSCAKAYSAGSFNLIVYGDGSEVLGSTAITNQHMFRLPSISRYWDMEASVTGSTNAVIESLLFAVSPQLLRMG